MAPQVYALKLFCVLSYISFLVNSIYKGGEGGGGGRGTVQNALEFSFQERTEDFFFLLRKA